MHFETNLGRKALVYRPNWTTWTVINSQAGIVPLHGKAGDFDEGEWARLERDFTADAKYFWPTATVTRVTGITLWSATGGTIWMDGLSFSNSQTVEQNVLGPGVIAHIMRNRTIDPSNYSIADSWFHYDQVGSVMLASNAVGSQQTTHYQDAWGNVLENWQTGRWDGGASGWHHNTKATDGDLGLVYMYQRWYLPNLGVFGSRAPYPPIVEHTFGSGFGNPTSFIDPDGRRSFPFGAGQLIIDKSCCGRDLSKDWRVKPEDGNKLIPMPPNPPEYVPGPEGGYIPRVGTCGEGVMDVDGVYGDGYILRIPDNATCTMKCGECGEVTFGCTFTQIFGFLPEPEVSPGDQPPPGWPPY